MKNDENFLTMILIGLAAGGLVSTKTRWYHYLWLLIPISIIGFAIYGVISLVMIVL